MDTLILHTKDIVRILKKSTILRVFLIYTLLINNFHSIYAQTTDTTSQKQIGTPQVPQDSIKATTSKKSSLEYPVDYNAEDSVLIDFKTETIFLYGKAYVKYNDIDIQADYIEYQFGKDLVVAKYVLDSAGEKTGRPVFNEGGESYTMDEIRYNTKTKKGVIFHVTTEQADGFLHSQKIKKHENNNIHLRKGKYTTCDKPENPHFHFRLSKAVVIPNDKIVSGPMNLYLGKIPTPLGLPFGFFPNNQNKGSNGLVFPEFGETAEYGFSLTNGGYYHTFGEKMDMSLLANIYSKGSWGLSLISGYNNRYKYNGNIDISYNNLKTGIKETSSFSRQSQFFVRWNHSQDPKARPGTKFSAMVNAGSTNNFQTGLDYNTNDYLNNRFQSNISYGKSWKGKPFNLAVNLRHEQNTSNNMINATLPEITFNLNRIDPLDLIRKKKIGKKKLNLGFSYSATAKNDISVADSLIDFANLGAIQSKFRNGMQHRASLNAPFKLAKVITSNTSINFTDRMYLQTINKYWDTELNQHITDTVSGFANNYDYNLSTSLTTTFYGMYGFSGPLKGKREAKIRHVLSPNISFTYRPDFSSSETYTDDSGQEYTYSPFDIGIFGKAPSGESGFASFSLVNSLEMKLKNLTDSSDNAPEFKKVKLIENITFRTGYDIMKDSLNLSLFQLTGRTTLFKIISINGGANFDPYHFVNGVKTNNLLLSKEGKLAFLSNANAAVGFILKSRTREKDGKTYFNPWDATINYNYFYNRQISALSDTAIVTNTVSLDGGVNVTEKWRFDTRVHYDHMNREIAFVEFNIYRDLHCWEASFNIIPFGADEIRRYTFKINIKAAMLKDLKWEKRNNNFNRSIL